MGAVNLGQGDVSFTLPPYSYMPNLSQAERDVADLIAAAMDSPHFPEAKESHIKLCNKRLELLFPAPVTKGPNRRVRRQSSRNQSKGRK